MSDKYEVEVLLRPPVEWYSALTASVAALVMLKAPTVLLLTPGTAYTAAALLAWLALSRSRQAWQVMRYQRQIKYPSRYTLAAHKIPISRQVLFLGKGFKWTQKHTERLYAARHKNAERYLQASWLTRWVRAKELAWEHTPLLQYLARFTAIDSAWNPWRPRPKTGGEAMLHGVGMDAEKPVTMPLSERPGHTAVVARTRHGKTRLAEVLITQDIHRGDNTVIVLDPKGDAGLLKRLYSETRKAKRQLLIFHLGYPTLSARYNAVGSFSRITEVASRTANPLPSDGNASAFKEFAWQFINVIAVALVSLGEQPDYRKLRRYIADIDSLFVRYAEYWLNQSALSDWQQQVDQLSQQLQQRKLSRTEQGRELHAVALIRYLKQQAVYDPTLEGLMSAFLYEREYFQKITVAIKPLLEKLTTGTLAEIIAPNLFNTEDQRPVLDWLEVIRTQAVVYVGLDALTDPEVAAVVGASMFSDLTSLAGHLYKHGIDSGLPKSHSIGNTRPAPIIIHGDEFSDLLGPQFKTLINKSGGAGYEMTLYTQTWSDVIAELGDSAKAGQLAGNIGTLIMMGVKEPQTCEMLTKQLPEVNVSEVMAVSSATDAADFRDGISFVSQNQDRISMSRVPMISPADIVALPKGEAFALLNGSEAWKIRIPLPSGEDNADLPDHLGEMLRAMRQQYRSVMQWQQRPDALDLSALS